MIETKLANRLEQAVCAVVRGQEETVSRVLACMFSGGNVLLEDYPGTGKTTLPKAITKSIGGAEVLRAVIPTPRLPAMDCGGRANVAMRLLTPMIQARSQKPSFAKATEVRLVVHRQ